MTVASVRANAERQSSYANVRSTAPRWFVYVMGSWSSGIVKIGTTTDLHGRRSMLQIGNPERLEILWFTAGGHDLERQLHLRLAGHRSMGEWFTFDDAQTALAAVTSVALEAVTMPRPKPSKRKRLPGRRDDAAPTTVAVEDVLQALRRFRAGATSGRIARAVPCSLAAVETRLNELRVQGLAQLVQSRNWWIAAENITIPVAPSTEESEWR